MVQRMRENKVPESYGILKQLKSLKVAGKRRQGLSSCFLNELADYLAIHLIRFTCIQHKSLLRSL